MKTFILCARLASFTYPYSKWARKRYCKDLIDWKFGIGNKNIDYIEL